MNKYLNKSIDLVIKYTPLNKHNAMVNLINFEALTHTKELCNNNCNIKQSYFYSTAAKIIENYKKVKVI